MPTSVQVKLLRVLETRSFFRVGGTKAIRVDVRVIAATNRPLKEAVAVGEFRDDLFYRLNVLNIYLPPLRERKSDIPILIRHFIREITERDNVRFRGIDPAAMEILINAHWPGNVRQLRNLIESMVVVAPGREIGPADIPRDIREGGTRLLPMRLDGDERAARDGGGVGTRELEFIFRSLVELKMQIEDMRRRMDEQQEAPVEVIDVGGRQPIYVAPRQEEPEPEEEQATVVYRPGMKMDDVEKAAIAAALDQTGGNRRKAAEQLGIGERTLYRKIKEYGL